MNMNLLMFLVFLGLVAFTIYLNYRTNKVPSVSKEELATANQIIGQLESRIMDYADKLKDTTSKYEESCAKFEKLQYQKISADVKLGQRYENILPFMEKFPYKDDEIRGLFNPIDLVVFRDNEVVFVEVKTGQSQLSEKQRQIRDNIKNGRVRFEVHRMDEKGVRIK